MKSGAAAAALALTLFGGQSASAEPRTDTLVSGGKSVTAEFELDAGEREVIKRTLHARIEVTIDVTVEVVSIDGTRHARGDTVSLSPGRHRVALYEKGAVVYEGYVQFPTTECTLRDNPELGCY